MRRLSAEQQSSAPPSSSALPVAAVATATLPLSRCCCASVLPEHPPGEVQSHCVRPLRHGI